MLSNTLNRVLEPTVVAEASTQQTFVDILDSDVINPLRTLKVSQEGLVQEGIPILIWVDPEGNERRDKEAA